MTLSEKTSRNSAYVWVLALFLHSFTVNGSKVTWVRNSNSIYHENNHEFIYSNCLFETFISDLMDHFHQKHFQDQFSQIFKILEFFDFDQMETRQISLGLWLYCWMNSHHGSFSQLYQFTTNWTFFDFDQCKSRMTLEIRF